MSDIHAKTGQLMNKGSAQQIGGSVGGAYDNTVAVKVHVIYRIGVENIHATYFNLSPPPKVKLCLYSSITIHCTLLRFRK